MTPALSRGYAARTAEHQAAFLLPYLRPGMSLLDAGCGPGSITMGLAGAVAPGAVTGIDHDPVHIDAASALAVQRRQTNASFRVGDLLDLPFDDATFDVAFENDVLLHLPENAVAAAREVLRVLRPGGIFAAREAVADAPVWGHHTVAIRELDRLFAAWHRDRGTDLSFGRRLPAVLREAGFDAIVKTASADTRGTPDSVRWHVEATLELLDGPFGRETVAAGRADSRTIERLRAGILEWGEHPDAFFANIHVEAVGWKPA